MEFACLKSVATLSKSQSPNFPAIIQKKCVLSIKTKFCLTFDSIRYLSFAELKGNEK